MSEVLKYSMSWLVKILLSLIAIFISQFCVTASVSPIIFESGHHTGISETYTYDKTKSSIWADTGFTGGLSRVLSEKEVRPDHEILGEVASLAARSSSKLTIQFGKGANQVSHAFRHTDKLGLNRSLVQSSVETHFKTVSSQVVAGKPFNQIINIGGQRIQYTAFKLPNGTFNIGRIHGVK
ncbi:MAG: hypothetical protein J4F31_02990 [Flavobacteriales bacterium]|nr:hypothetical protein [Flavobacteriales bacterium]